MLKGEVLGAMRVGTTVDSEGKNMFFIQVIRSALKNVQQLAK